METEDESRLGLFDQEERHKQTMFHGGFLYVERLDKIFKCLDEICLPTPTQEKSNTDKFAKQELVMGVTLRRIMQRHALLNVLFRELFPKMNPEERTEHKDANKECSSEFRTFQVKILNGGKANPDVLEMFDEWELELRALADKKGLLMPTKQSGLDATSS